MENKQSILGIQPKSNEQLSLNAVQQPSIQKIEPPNIAKTEKLKISPMVPIAKGYTTLQSYEKSSSTPNITVQQNNSIRSPAQQSTLPNVSVQQSPAMQDITQPQMQNVSKMETISSPQIQKNNVLPSQADMLKFNENKNKELKNKFEEKLKSKESTKIFSALQPVFQNIESSLKFQAKMMQKDKDFDTPHYTVPLAQSQFNLTANQISGMPAWRN